MQGQTVKSSRKYLQFCLKYLQPAQQVASQPQQIRVHHRDGPPQQGNILVVHRAEMMTNEYMWQSRYSVSNIPNLSI